MRTNKDAKETTRRLIKAGIALGILGGGAAVHMDAYAEEVDTTTGTEDGKVDIQGTDNTIEETSSNEQAATALETLAGVWNETQTEEDNLGAVNTAVSEVDSALNTTDELVDLANGSRSSIVKADTATDAQEDENASEEATEETTEEASGELVEEAGNVENPEDGNAPEEATTGSTAEETVETKELKPSETIAEIEKQLEVITAPAQKEETEVNNENAGSTEETQTADESLSIDTTEIKSEIDTIQKNLEKIKDDTTLSELANKADGLVKAAGALEDDVNKALAAEDLGKAESALNELSETKTNLEETLKKYSETLGDLKDAKADALEAAGNVKEYLENKLEELEALEQAVKDAQKAFNDEDFQKLKELEASISTGKFFVDSYTNGTPFDLDLDKIDARIAEGKATYSDLFVEFLRSYIAKEVFDGAEVESIECCRWSKTISYNDVKNVGGGDVLNYYKVKFSGIDEPQYFNYKIGEQNKTNSYTGLVIFEKTAYEVNVENKSGSTNVSVRNDLTEENRVEGVEYVTDYRNDNWYTGDIVLAASTKGENYSYTTDGKIGVEGGKLKPDVIKGDEKFDGLFISTYYDKGLDKYEDVLAAIKNAKDQISEAKLAVNTLIEDITKITFADKNAKIEDLQVKQETVNENYEDLQGDVSDLRDSLTDDNGGGDSSNATEETVEEEGGSVLGANRAQQGYETEEAVQEEGKVLGAERGRGKSPKTGDASNALGAAAMMGSSLAGAGAVLGLRRKKN